jgi:hypothetical protein
MASVADAVKVIVAETGEPEATVNQIARYLVNIGELPKNRGRIVSKVDEGHLALLLLAIYTAVRHTSAPARAREYAELRRDGVPAGEPFLSFLTRALSDMRNRPDRHVRISEGIDVHSDDLRIEIITSYPLVIVSADMLFAEPPFEDIGFAGTTTLMTFWPEHKPRRSVTIPGVALFAIVSGVFGTGPNSKT